MAQGFYELLGVDGDAPPNQIREAFQRRLAELVRRLRVARQQGADVSILEAQERAVREAMEVLSDGVRRRRYDAYLQVMRGSDFPEDAERLWEQARGGMVDPVAGIALAAVRALTRLPVGDPLPEPPPGYSQKRAWTVDLADPAAAGPASPPAAAPGSATSPAAASAAASASVHAPAGGAASEGPARVAISPVQIMDDIEIVRMPAPSIAVGLQAGTGPARPPAPELDFDVEAAPTDPRIGIHLPPPPGRRDLDALDGDPAPAAPRLGLLSRLAALASGSSAPAPAHVVEDDPDDPWAEDRGIFDLDQGPQVAEPADPIDRLIRQHGKGAALLRAVREHRGLTLEELARTTRISGRYLAALEEGAFDRLPSATFVRGYLRQVAQVLELGDRGVVEGYMALFTQQRG